MSVSGLRDAIKTALENVSGLRVYDTVPDSIQVPCAFVVPNQAPYHKTFSSATVDHEFVVTVLVSRVPSTAEAQDALDDYIEPSGSSSIRAAVEATTLSTHGSDIVCTRYRDYGGMQFGAETYLGVRFDVTVMVD